MVTVNSTTTVIIGGRTPDNEEGEKTYETWFYHWPTNRWDVVKGEYEDQPSVCSLHPNGRRIIVISEWAIKF